MKADSASHLVRQAVKYEALLFFYLTCALVLQEINIYKTNIHLIDFNLLTFIVAILGRRLAWCIFQGIQTHWCWTSPVFSTSSSITAKRCAVFLCTLFVILWSVLQLIRRTSLFNLMFLFYPLLLYLSLFGFTLEPRWHQNRYEPPKQFLQHLSISSRYRSHFKQTKVYSSSSTLATSDLKQAHTVLSQTVQDKTSLPPSEVKYMLEYSLLLLPATPDEIRNEVDVLLSDLLVRFKQLLFNSLLCAYYVGFIPMQFADNHIYYDRWWCLEHTLFVWANSFVILSTRLLPPSYCQVLHQCAVHLGCWTKCVHSENASIWSPDQTWMCDEVVQWKGESFRGEGPQNVAIPCDTSQECFYETFLVDMLLNGANLESRHCVVRAVASMEKEEEEDEQFPKLTNVISSCKRESKFSWVVSCMADFQFGVLFHSRLQVYTWLLAMQSVLVAFQIVVLLRSVYWYQIISMSVLLSFNYFVLYKLLYNRLIFRVMKWLS